MATDDEDDVDVPHKKSAVKLLSAATALEIAARAWLEAPDGAASKRTRRELARCAGVADQAVRDLMKLIRPGED